MVKKGRLKKTKTIHFQGLNVLDMQKHFWFMSSFKHVKFAINGKYSKNNYDNPNYYAWLVIFQTYKNAILRSVHSLGWLLWLCSYPWGNSSIYENFPFLQAKTRKLQRKNFLQKKVTIYFIQVQPFCNEVNHNHQACPFHLPLHPKVGRIYQVLLLHMFNNEFQGNKSFTTIRPDL